MSTTSGFPLRLSTFEGTDYLFSFVIIAMKGIYDFLRLTVIFIWSAGIVVEDSTCFEEDIPRHEIAASDTNRLYQRPESRKRILMLWVRTRTLRWILGRKPRAFKAVNPTNKSCSYERMYLEFPFLLQLEIFSYTMIY